MTAAHLVLHLPGSVLRDPEALLKPYYRRIIDGFRDRGGVVDRVLHDRDLVAAEVSADADFHLIDHGTCRHPRVLNTGIAYLYPFWNLDPWGIRAASSIAEMPYRPGRIDAAAATAFCDRLARRLIGARTSRYEQPQGVVAFPKGCIAVFLQSEAHRAVEETCYLSREAMIAALLARDDPGAIVLKIHPRDTDPASLLALQALRTDPRVIVTAANIHDILAAASVTVTINSAVGVESLLHAVPVVLCGRADFHHGCVTVRSAAEMSAGLAEAATRRWTHRRFLYWYFALNCINAGKADFLDDVLARIATTGFDLGRFGLAGGQS